MVGVGWIMVVAAAGVFAGAGSQVVPTTYEAGHFYATPETADGQTLRLLVDTGGGGTAGLYWISAEAAKRLGLATHACTLQGFDLTAAAIPAYKPEHGLPAPLPGPCGTALMVQDTQASGDGQLGGTYLMGRTWTFDYPGQQLRLEPSSWRPDTSMHAASLGFLRNAQGEAATAFARITIQVDGQAVDMLLDTGATAHPTAAGKQASHTATVHGFGTTSYIASSMLERWHKAHPTWRVVQNGDDLHPQTKSRLIEVPTVDIAGWRTGPVWFTEQPDAAYHVYMAQWMDKPVNGALGGNVFAHFVMTIDYPHAAAYFRCVTDCNAAAASAPSWTAYPVHVDDAGHHMDGITPSVLVRAAVDQSIDDAN